MVLDIVHVARDVWRPAVGGVRAGTGLGLDLVPGGEGAGDQLAEPVVDLDGVALLVVDVDRVVAGLIGDVLDVARPAVVFRTTRTWAVARLSAGGAVILISSFLAL